MTRTMIVLLLCTAVLATAAWAEKEPWLYSAADAQVGPVANYMDAQWDLLGWFNAQATTTDDQLLGGEFGYGHFYISGGGGTSGLIENTVWVLNPDGTLAWSFLQWSSAGWGWRDLAFDGTYFYGSDDLVVDCFDQNGNPVPGNNINGPVNPARALAYQPDNDSFWAASFSTPIYNFTRTGAVLWSGASGLAGVYGMAWDDAAPDGPWLWIFDQSGTPATTFHKFNPTTHVVVESYTVPLIGGSSDQIAGGCFFTNEWDPTYWTMGGITQGTPADLLFMLEMYDNADPLAPGAPQNFTVSDNGPDLLASLEWDNPTVTVNGSPLTTIDDIVVKRDGVIIDHLAGNPGDHMTYDDAVPAAGNYAYTVYCVNSYGDGIPASGSAWIGPDVPAGVENLVGAGVGILLEANLTWDNPTAGAHGGYFDPASITGYTINRYGPSAATFTVAGIATSFNDNTIPVQGWYHYGVICENASGPGPEAMSNNFYVGPAEFEEIPYAWIEIDPNDPTHVFAGTNTNITGDDQNLGPFNLGFTFPFYENFTSIRVCSNGFASFTSTSTAYTNAAIPTAAEPNNLVAPFWDDMNPSQYGTIWYYSDLAGGRFIIEWDEVAHYSTGGMYTFEIILYDDGTIDYMYKELTPGTANSATVGVENSTGTVGVQCTYNGSGPLEPVPQMGIRIYPVPGVPTPVTLTSFYANVEPTGVLLSWNTASEIECHSWNLERNGEVVATLAGHGTTSEPQSYSYLDQVGNGTYTYTLKQVDISGSVNTMGDLTVTVGAVTKFALNSNYPNPFNPSTVISYSIPEASKVTLNVYDISGRMVGTLVNGWKGIGNHEVTFDGTGLSSGVYIYELTAGNFKANGKMVMMK